MSGAGVVSFEAPRVGVRKTRRVNFLFYPQGTGAPTVPAAMNPWVASIARTGVGVYLITLKETHAALLGHGCAVQCASGTARQATFGGFTNIGTSSAVTAYVRTEASDGSANDMAANANNSVSGYLEFAEGV